MMQLPLTLTEMNSCWATIYTATGRRVCACYGDDAIEDGTELVVAVNGRAAMQAEIERLQEALDGLLAVIRTDMRIDVIKVREDALAPWARWRRALGKAYDALDAPEEPRP